MEVSSEYFTEMLLSYIFGPSVVRYDILSNNSSGTLHAVINCVFFKEQLALPLVITECIAIINLFHSPQMSELQAQQQSTASSSVTPPSVSSSTVPERNSLPSTSTGPSSTSTAPSGELQSLEKQDQDQAKVNSFISFHCGRYSRVDAVLKIP